MKNVNVDQMQVIDITHTQIYIRNIYNLSEQI